MQVLMVLRKLEQYTKAYGKLKASRQLVWKNHLGNVDIELEFSEKTLSFSVSPVLATIIMYFQEQGK